MACFVRAACLGLPCFWYISRGQVHAGQFTERTAGNFWMTAAAYWNTLESFVLIAPYYLGYPVFAFALVGLARIRRAVITPWAPVVILPALLGLLLLALHS